jgi:hypothetical protein
LLPRNGDTWRLAESFGLIGPAAVTVGHELPDGIWIDSDRRSEAGTAPEQWTEQFSYVEYPVVCERPAGAVGVPAGVGGGAVETAATVFDAVTVAWVRVFLVVVLELGVVSFTVDVVELLTLAAVVELEEVDEAPPQPATATASSSAGSHLM